MAELRLYLGLATSVFALSALLMGCSDEAPAGTESETPPAGENNTPANNEMPDGPEDVDPCGNGICDAGEQTTCPDDCEAPDPTPEPTGPECGDGNCDDDEDEVSCPEDCDEGPPEQICEPGQSRCLSINAIEICSEDGTRFVTQPCDVGTVCVDDTCTEVICRPGAVDSCASQNSIFICNESGTGTVEVVCEEPLFCDFVNGSFACTDQICNPGDTRCRGLEGLEICSEDGTQWVPGDQCPPGTQCDNGQCPSLCEINS